MHVSKADLNACQRRIKPYIHRTPVMSSGLLNELTGADLFFKCENFQRMGAFKIRGAVNAILQLTEDQKRKGVITHSSGNFAQALSLAAKSIGITAYIIMPENAPKVKIEVVESYGGEITFCAPTLKDRIDTTKKYITKTNATFIHPSNNMDVIIGQSTVAKEFLEERRDLNLIVSPVGGGGLIAGTGLSAKYYGKSCEVIGAEPFEADDAFRSLKSGEIEQNITTNTIADGLKTSLGDLNFPIIQETVSRIIRVEESDIIQALRLIWERLKIIVEPSSAVAFAAVLKDPLLFKGKKTGIILSGGNIDLDNLPSFREFKKPS